MLVYRSISRGELDVNKLPQTPAQRTGRRARRKKSSLVRRFWWKQVMCDAPGWWLAGLLVIAPWAYGTTFPQTKELLAGALLVLIGLFVISRLIQRRWPKVHWLPAALTLIILTQGWVMVLNPKLVYDSTVQYFHFVPGVIPWLPGTVDRGTSLDQMWLITGLFGAFWAVNDLAAALLVWSVGFKDAYRHWAELGKSLVSDGDGRFMLYGAIVRYIIPASGWWGFGAGTFHLIFPFFTNNLGTRLQGYWEYAHEDYLQTLVEWGFCGATAWFIFFGQTVARATWTLGRRYRRWSGNTRRFAIASLLALETILVHATVDFPMQIASLQLYTAVP